MIRVRACSKCFHAFLGYGSYCRLCKNEYTRHWRATSPKYPEWLEANQVQVNARGTAGIARQRGILKKEPCEVCGSTLNVESHHEDYSKALDVRWLCREHHLMVTYGFLSLIPLKTPKVLHYNPLRINALIALAANKLRRLVHRA